MHASVSRTDWRNVQRSREGRSGRWAMMPAGTVNRHCHTSGETRAANMSITLNHTIVYARNRDASAAFLAEILGLPEPKPFGPFLAVQLDNGVTLDFYSDDHQTRPEHYAFLVSETEFDCILARIQSRGLPYWADPFHRRQGEINTNDGGRGTYFEDPSGHNLEIITQPYGSGA
jgi:catechol 2,3-dioxygenase-like lactoylglutathione lyase family enzyme